MNADQLAQFFPGEEIKLVQEGWLVKSFFNVKTGFTIITNKRIGFIEKKVVIGGAIVKIADAALGVSKPKLKVDVPFTDLKVVTWPKRIDLQVENKSGEKFKFRALDQQKVNQLLPNL